MAANSSQSKSDSDSDPDENNHLPRPLQLDLGDDLVHNPDNGRLGFQASSVSDASKKEDNPFSFKHFLRGGSSFPTSRSSVYRDNRSHNNSDIYEPNHSRKLPEYSSALPDFVQDHLVVEQCLLGATPVTSSCSLDLPELAHCSIGPRNGDLIQRNHSPVQEVGGHIPLDLPGLPLGGTFPLDLPLNNGSGQSRNIPIVAEVNNASSLPDFLADGAVCPSSDGSPLNSTVTNGHEVNECGDLETLRRQLAEQTRQCFNLHNELAATRTRAERDAREVAAALESVEENLERSNRRAAAAENVATKLRQEIKDLRSEIVKLKSENHALKNGECSSGSSRDYFSAPREMPSYRLAQDLRTAASTAEQSLRQLLTGVDNLRMMASTLENLHRIEEDRLHISDDNTGPAL
ncbi:uncharacterized protein LOC132707479 [Cylas formicarius]|uniref:uncharacterized protein LOC132707479 n=1 Tax=Cylas formicarius TaxID=197179 RepID=UPI002958BADD|nr:uncharacterized protein LOC132707479 [Cylas formicarius]